MKILGNVNQPNHDGSLEEKEPILTNGGEGGSDLMKLLGGIGKPSGKKDTLENPNGGWEYTNYDDVVGRYVPISETYKPFKYDKPTYESATYESHEYEPATEMLFGEQGKSWENSPVFKDTGIGKILQERGEHKSVFDDDKELKDMLFGGNEPTGDDLSGRLFGISNKEQPTEVVGETVNIQKIIDRIAEREPYSRPLPTSMPVNPTSLAVQPIYSKSPSTPMPNTERRKGGRPKGTKNRPPPGGPSTWNTGMSQTK